MVENIMRTPSPASMFGGTGKSRRLLTIKELRLKEPAVSSVSGLMAPGKRPGLSTSIQTPMQPRAGLRGSSRVPRDQANCGFRPEAQGQRRVEYYISVLFAES
jgi:hypothetical protein